MRKTAFTFLAGVLATLIVIGPILLLWVKEERQNRCEITNQNISNILILADEIRDFMSTFVAVLISFADPTDPESQQNVDSFLVQIQPSFDAFDEAAAEINQVEC